MNTAMQELIKYIDDSLAAKSYSIKWVKDKATELLKKEEEQIKQAYKDGALEGESSNINYNPQEYFNETYK